ncbi:MAG: hypothetical protein ABR510_08640 [Trueperaceae bacterium]
MRTTLLLAAVVIAGLAWAQPFGPNQGRGPIAQAVQVEMQVQADADGECIGARTMTRTGRGEGGQAMVQRQLKAADGQHAQGPVGRQLRGGNR